MVLLKGFYLKKTWIVMKPSTFSVFVISNH